MADLMHTKDIVFKVKNIFKQIKKQTIINNVLFLVRRNSIKVFAGENGAGKSTLMRICTGNDLDFEGSLYFNNKNMNDIKEAKSFLFFCNRFNISSKSKCIWICAKLFPTQFINEKFREYKLEHLIKNNPNTFSSGEKKKLVLLFSELAKPELLFLDKPDSNLEPISRIKD